MAVSMPTIILPTSLRVTIHIRGKARNLNVICAFSVDSKEDDINDNVLSTEWDEEYGNAKLHIERDF